MNTLDLPNRDATGLARAIALLDSVGRGAGRGQSAAAVECLAAAELLAALVPAQATPVLELADGDVSIAIEECLHLLAHLSPSTFALERVGDAVDAAQRAYALASRA